MARGKKNKRNNKQLKSVQESNNQFNKNNNQFDKSYNKIFIKDGIISVGNTDYDLSDKEDIDKLREYCSKNKKDSAIIKSLITNYSDECIVKYNLIAYGSGNEKMKPLQKDLFNYINEDCFVKSKLINAVLETYYKEAGIESKETALAAGIKKMSNIGNKKIKDLDQSKKADFDDFLNFLGSLNSKKLIEDFSIQSGAGKYTDFENLKKRFYEIYSAAEGADFIKKFAEKYKHLLSNDGDIYARNDNTLTKNISKLDSNTKKINEISRQISSNSNDNAEQIKLLMSTLEKSKELDEKMHPYKCFFCKLFTLGLFSYTSDRTENLARTISIVSNRILNDQTLMSSVLVEKRDDVIKKQLAAIDGLNKNTTEYMKSEGINFEMSDAKNGEYKTINLNIDYNKQKELRNNDKIKENIMNISKVKDTEYSKFFSGVNNDLTNKNKEINI